MSTAPTLPARHPISDEFLLDYATGAAPEPVSVLVASHVALNPEIRVALRQLETAGGALLEGIAPAPVASDAWTRLAGRLGSQDVAISSTPGADTLVPEPLQAYIGDGLESLPWRSLAWGLSEAVLPCTQTSPFKLSLLRIGAGRAFPRHTHRGAELVMVLEGGFSDEHGHYLRGDVCIADEAVEHRPVADAGGDCLCLAVTRGPIRFKGLLGVFLNPFLRA